MKRIYLVGGGKGGVGKSLVSSSLVDYLKSLDEKILLIETDTSNPDVYKAYKDEVTSEAIDLDNADGWIELVNLCDKHSDSIVVINTAARSDEGVRLYGETLNNTLAELKRELVTFWVINRGRDSLELLAKYMAALPSQLHVIRNGHYGEASKFALYESSKIKKTVEEKGLSLQFPDLADRVADDLSTRRLSISVASRDQPIGNRAELQRWRNEAKRMFDQVIKG